MSTKMDVQHVSAILELYKFKVELLEKELCGKKVKINFDDLRTSIFPYDLKDTSYITFARFHSITELSVVVHYCNEPNGYIYTWIGIPIDIITFEE